VNNTVFSPLDVAGFGVILTSGARRAAILVTLVTGSLIASTAFAQTLPDIRPAPGSQPLVVNRVFGLVPVVDTPSLSDDEVAPLSNRQKFEFFFRTAIDPGTAIIAVTGAGIDSKGSAQPAYEGAAAFGKKAGAIAADYASNTLISRSLLPMILRQDPRFFRMEGGSVGSRAMYAATRVFVAHTDSGHNTLNTSLLGGTALSTALANVYYPDRNRNGTDTAIRYGIDIGINMTVNVVREFWKLHR
jgi:hypothetical protein